MSVELVMDGLVVGKAASAGVKGYKAYASGSKFVRGAAKASMRAKLKKDALWGAAGFATSSTIKIVSDQTGPVSSVSQRMMEAEWDRFQDTTADEKLTTANTILEEVANPSFRSVDLIPFVSPIRRLNKMGGADTLVDQVGAAQTLATRERYRAEKLVEAQEEKLTDLLRQLGRKEAELEASKKKGGS